MSGGQAAFLIALVFSLDNTMKSAILYLRPFGLKIFYLENRPIGLLPGQHERNAR
jgi:hypothetical protein